MITTFVEAVNLARAAKARGLAAVYVTVNASGRFHQSRSPVRAWRDVPGVSGLITGRCVNNESGVIEELVLLVDVVDIIAANSQLWVASLGDEPEPARWRSRFSTAR